MKLNKNISREGIIMLFLFLEASLFVVVDWCVILFITPRNVMLAMPIVVSDRIQ